MTNTMFLYMMTVKQWCDILRYNNIFSVEFIIFLNYTSIDSFIVLLATKMTAKHRFFYGRHFHKTLHLKELRTVHNLQVL